MPNQPERVVCLGGGYGALWFVFRLRRAIRRGDLEVTVISRDNFHVFHGFIGEMLAGRIQPEQVISSARRIFEPARFFNAEIEAVDLDRRQVTTSRMLDGRQYEVPYDHLLFNLGSTDDHARYRSLEIRLNTRVTAATPEEAVLSDGERIPTRTIVSCSGTAMAPLVQALPVEKHESGRLAVRPTGQLTEHDHLWGAGDCAALPHPDGGVCPQTAIYAMVGGRHAAGNLLRSRKKKTPRPFRFSGLGEAASLGHRRAIYNLRGLRVTGFPAWVLWRLTFLLFMPSWRLRLRVVADWIVTALTGRNITNVQMREPYGVQRQRYESGQIIVSEGDIGQRLFVIVEGEAEVVRKDGNDNETVLTQLGPGQHFGEMAIFQNVRRTATVRAVTPVEVLALGHAASRALSEAVEPFGATVRRKPSSGSPSAEEGVSAS